MFSATANLLPGSLERPDILVLTQTQESPGRFQGQTLAAVCTLNRLGYIPIVSTITGLGRALLGIIHTIVHLVSAIFDRKNQTHHFQEASLGAMNIARGLVEAIPIIGNLTVSIIDAARVRSWKVEESKDGSVIALSAYGKEIAQKPQDEVEVALAALNRPPILADIINILAPPKFSFSTPTTSFEWIAGGLSSLNRSMGEIRMALSQHASYPNKTLVAVRIEGLGVEPFIGAMSMNLEKAPRSFAWHATLHERMSDYLTKNRAKKFEIGLCIRTVAGEGLYNLMVSDKSIHLGSFEFAQYNGMSSEGFQKLFENCNPIFRSIAHQAEDIFEDNSAFISEA